MTTPQPPDPQRQIAPHLAGAPSAGMNLGALLAPLKPLLEGQLDSLEGLPPAQLAAMARRLQERPALVRLAAYVLIEGAHARLGVGPDVPVLASVGADVGGIHGRAEAPGRLQVFRM